MTKLLGWQIFVGVLGGTTFMAGIISGVYYVFDEVLGFNKDKKKLFGFSGEFGTKMEMEAGVVPASILGVGLFSTLSWIIWLFIAYSCEMSESNTRANFIFVIIVGVILGGSVCTRLHLADKDVIGILFAVCSIGMILFGIASGVEYKGIGSGFFCGFFYWIIGALIYLIQVNFILLIIWFITKIFTPLFILLKYKNIICNNCYRYSVPLKSNYEHGIRKCEHCNNTLERTKDTGKVIFTFGENNLKPERIEYIVSVSAGLVCLTGENNLKSERRKFILPNPDFEKKNSPIDVSEVYIDTNSCDKHLLERFITYIVNYPPKYGLKSVRIFIRGTLDDLGHLKNSILNNFARVSQI